MERRSAGRHIPTVQCLDFAHHLSFLVPPYVMVVHAISTSCSEHPADKQIPHASESIPKPSYGTLCHSLDEGVRVADSKKGRTSRSKLVGSVVSLNRGRVRILRPACCRSDCVVCSFVQRSPFVKFRESRETVVDLEHISILLEVSVYRTGGYAYRSKVPLRFSRYLSR